MITRLIPALSESIAFPNLNLRFEIDGSPTPSDLANLIHLNVTNTIGNEIVFRQIESQSPSIRLLEYSWLKVTREVATQTNIGKRRKKKHSRKKTLVSGISIFKYLRIRDSLVNSNQ
jgi:hypothetical protein